LGRRAVILALALTSYPWGCLANGDSSKVPQSAEEWKALVAATASQDTLRLVGLSEKFGVTIAPQVVGGVPCYLVTPKIMEPKNHGRLLIALHGGGFIFGGGQSGLLEAIEMAGLTRLKVIAVDYRMPPDHPFPATMDDVMAVWRGAVNLTNPASMGVFGTSAGGGLVLSLVQRAKKEGLPLPAAIMAGTPASDLSKTGDSYYTNAGVDNRLVRYEGLIEALLTLYANGRDLKDPLLSPVYGDFTGFPPTFLVSGTRDLFLSNTVRVQQKLLQAGVPALLEVEEGQSHADYLLGAMADAPESVALYSHIADFFDAHLGR
jgi:epsilon-lactone hydrolase